jgi:membrane associated rhomboid family serine protease
MRLPDSWKNARVTAGLAIVTIAIWLALAVLGLDEWAAIGGGFIPARLTYGDDGGMVLFFLTPLTAAFLHGGAAHLFFNMLILIYCGRPVESVLGPIGMAILYLTGAYAAAAAQYAMDPLSIVPMIGASGAISAVVGAYALLFGRNKVKLKSARLALWLNALWLMVAWVVLSLAVGFAFATISAGAMQIAAAAHIGGFLAGLLLANPLLLFRYRKA